MVVHSDLLKSGFLPNEEKSVWDPTQVITWLGAVINTSQCVIKATDKRIDSLINNSSSLLSSERSLHQLCKLASVCGKIISLGNCVGYVTRLMTRNTFLVINSTADWNSLVSLTPECLHELNFWKNNLADIGLPLWPIKRKPSKIVYSVASNSAYGSYIQFKDKIFHHNWSDYESAQSSTFCKLLAVSLSLKAFEDSLGAHFVFQSVSALFSGFEAPYLKKAAL